MHNADETLHLPWRMALRALGLHCSDDSVTRRHRAALARQRDLGVEAEGDVHVGPQRRHSSQAALLLAYSAGPLSHCRGSRRTGMSFTVCLAGCPPEAPILPSALSALGALDRPPDYLTPEATRCTPKQRSPWAG